MIIKQLEETTVLESWENETNNREKLNVEAKHGHKILESAIGGLIMLIKRHEFELEEYDKFYSFGWRNGWLDGIVIKRRKGVIFPYDLGYVTASSSLSKDTITLPYKENKEYYDCDEYAGKVFGMRMKRECQYILIGRLFETIQEYMEKNSGEIIELKDVFIARIEFDKNSEKMYMNLDINLKMLDKAFMLI